MRIGVVSDTHNNLKSTRRIVELFNQSRVDRVIHTGDITQAKTLDVLAGLHPPLLGVYGNNDKERTSLGAAADQHGFTFVDPPLTLHWHGRKIIVVHDPLEFDGEIEPEHELALHGHTHRFRHQQQSTSAGRQAFFNPGECAGHLSGHNAIGIVDLRDLSVELIKF